jgi:isopentenyl phosphate kinase
MWTNTNKTNQSIIEIKSKTTYKHELSESSINKVNVTGGMKEKCFKLFILFYPSVIFMLTAE